MFAMTFALRWSWVLGIALFFPVALPAGGGERYQPEICSWEYRSSLFTCNSYFLKSSPSALAPSLRTLQVGTPIRVLRRWQSVDGKEWLQVQIASSEIFELSSLARRGWISS